MKNKPHYEWICCMCHSPATLHEIFFGNGNRDICIEYNLQVPLCQECHNNAHGKGRASISQLQYKERFSKILNIDGEYAEMLVRNPKISREYLDFVKDRAKANLLEYLSNRG